MQFRAEGAAGLRDRSSRPRSSPTRTSSDREQAVLDARRSVRFGPLRIAALTGVPARTVGPDPATTRDPEPGGLRSAVIHLDVKKLGRIPEGGEWRAQGRSEQVRGRGIGYGYVEVAAMTTPASARPKSF
jgi:hypothetical protein